MSRMYKLYALRGSCSLASHILLEEIGLPFELVLLDLSKEEDGQTLASKNPMRLVPVLEFPDGTVLTQNLAILLHLASGARERKLFPEAGTLVHARAMEWMTLLATNVHTAFTPFFRPGSFHPEEGEEQKVRDAAVRRIEQVFRVMEDRAPESGWFLGADFSLVDLYHFVFFRWLRVVGIDEARFPKLRRLADAVRAREATQRALARENIRR
jgi:glutathione S-transferase